MAENTAIETGGRILTIKMVKELLATLPPEADDMPAARWDYEVNRLMYVQEILPAKMQNLESGKPDTSVIVFH